MSVEQCVRCQGSMVEDDSAKYTLTAGKEWFCITCGHREYRGETPSFRSKEYSRDEQFGGGRRKRVEVYLNEEDKDNIVRLWKGGTTQAQLANKFEIGRAAVRKVLNDNYAKIEGRVNGTS